jgi:transposase
MEALSVAAYTSMVPASRVIENKTRAGREADLQARFTQSWTANGLPVRARNLVERFFNKIKQCRRIATRYDKLSANYLAFIKLACIRIWLRANESTP